MLNLQVSLMFALALFVAPDTVADPPTNEAAPIGSGDPENDGEDIIPRAGRCDTKASDLRCDCRWHNTWAGTDCQAGGQTVWRFKVKCAWGGDYTGPWHTGSASDSYECTHGVKTARVERP